MKQLTFLTLFLSAALMVAGRGSASEAVISNMRASQISGTKLVEVVFGVAGGTPPYVVSLEGSADGGVTWMLPVTSVSGNVGGGVTAGLARKITWNAGVDWDGQVSDTVRFRVTTTGAPPNTYGDLVRIPAGNFQMGDQSNPRVGRSEEIPVHTVYLSEFYMAKYETTKELWNSVRAWGISNGRGYTDLAMGNGSYGPKGPNHPVHSISWYDMVKWCNARSEMENLVPCYRVNGAIYRTGQNSAVVCNWSANGYRLPTEAEWEKAARGGKNFLNFPWGDKINHDNANYKGNNSAYNYDTSRYTTYTYHPLYAVGGFPYTAPVDSFAPNDYGLYNMAGNVWEWCWDWYGSYTSASQTDPHGAPSGTNRVDRGGGWYWSNASYCRSSYRDGEGPEPGGFNYELGFRFVRTSVP